MVLIKEESQSASGETRSMENKTEPGSLGGKMVFSRVCASNLPEEYSFSIAQLQLHPCEGSPAEKTFVWYSGSTSLVLSRKWAM